MQLTKGQFQKKATAAFIRQNPTAQITGWIGCKKVKFPTGVVEWTGTFHAVAEGYRPKLMHASGADDYVMVR